MSENAPGDLIWRLQINEAFGDSVRATIEIIDTKRMTDQEHAKIAAALAHACETGEPELIEGR